MSGQTSCVLYKWPESWGLPSLSPACIQAEAYLRLANVDFAVEVCSTSSSSPTGQLPALERGAYISPAEADEFTAATAVIAHLKKHVKDLDARLSMSQRADLLAFTTLVESRLNAATLMTMWYEAQGFREHKKAAYGNKLPFPLSYIVPWSKQREVLRRLALLGDAGQVYPGAAAVIDAVADRLRAAGGRFFFGAEPSSLDAVLAGHLMYYRQSAAAAPVLQEKVRSQPVLCDYLDRLLGGHFAAPVPSRSEAAAAAAGPSWSDAAKGQKKPPPPPVEPTAAEKQFRRNSYYWLMGAGAAITSYVLLSGKYVKFATMVEHLEDDEEDEGDDEDDEEEP